MQKQIVCVRACVCVHRLLLLLLVLHALRGNNMLVYRCRFRCGPAVHCSVCMCGCVHGAGAALFSGLQVCVCACAYGAGAGAALQQTAARVWQCVRMCVQCCAERRYRYAMHCSVCVRQSVCMKFCAGAVHAYVPVCVYACVHQ